MSRKMNRKILLCLLVCLGCCMNSLKAQDHYKPTWKSLDSRPVPDWFQNAKFGIFIHWGPYSVPAWSPKGTYSEWYQYWLQEETNSFKIKVSRGVWPTPYKLNRKKQVHNWQEFNDFLA